MLSIFKKKETPVETTPEDKIAEAVRQHVMATSIIEHASQQVSEANINLAALVADHRAEQARIEVLITDAEQVMAQNNQLKVKIDALVGE